MKPKDPKRLAKLRSKVLVARKRKVLVAMARYWTWLTEGPAADPDYSPERWWQEVQAYGAALLASDIPPKAEPGSFEAGCRQGWLDAIATLAKDVGDD